MLARCLVLGSLIVFSGAWASAQTVPPAPTTTPVPAPIPAPTTPAPTTPVPAPGPETTPAPGVPVAPPGEPTAPPAAPGAPPGPVAPKPDRTPGPNLAFIDPKDVDEDYDFIGEYTGNVQAGMGGTQAIGLQVLAVGQGQFLGTMFIGGLPGEGWNGFARVGLTGQRDGDVCVLVGGAFRIFISRAGTAYIRYVVTSGWDLGTLQKKVRKSPSVGTEPPCNACILFNGKSTENFVNGRMTPDGSLMHGTEFARVYRDYTLHIEFMTPYMPYARGQGRGNSGVYLQSSYEVQVLDSFGLAGTDNECGALYKQKKPDSNQCLPPLVWQAYDIDFTSPRFDESGKKIKNARITVRHNGVVIHNDYEILTKTGAGAAESPILRPIKLQDHKNPVVFRNIWIIEKHDPDLDGTVSEPTVLDECCRPVCHICRLQPPAPPILKGAAAERVIAAQAEKKPSPGGFGNGGNSYGAPGYSNGGSYAPPGGGGGQYGNGGGGAYGGGGGGYLGGGPGGYTGGYGYRGGQYGLSNFSMPAGQYGYRGGQYGLSNGNGGGGYAGGHAPQAGGPAPTGQANCPHCRNE